jgi:predicted nucleic acid-binding protein
MMAVSNASPLIVFARVGRLDLLGEMYSTVLVPPAVWREVAEAGARPGAAAIARAAWLQRRSVAAPRTVIQGTARRLGPGESEAIALANEFAGSVPLLLDDLKGRRVALELGLPVVRSAGVLVAAKDLELIAVRPLLEDLRNSDLHLSRQPSPKFSGERESRRAATTISDRPQQRERRGRPFRSRFVRRPSAVYQGRVQP